jgi:hypothetical protein
MTTSDSRLNAQVARRHLVFFNLQGKIIGLDSLAPLFAHTLTG